MAIGLLGRKVGMTQLYDDTGKVIPVTVLEVGPCDILQVRTPQRDGYEAVQLGFLDKPRRLAIRAERGHVAPLESKRSKDRKAAGQELPPKPNCEPKRFIREFRAALDEYKIKPKAEGESDEGGDNGDAEESQADVGATLKVDDVFEPDQAVDVTGTSKGRGTAGVMKRHNFHGQRASHGVKKVHRHAGSIGCSAYPGRVIRGRRMAGQYGNARVTTRNLKVVRVDAENNLLVLRGAVPGPNGGFVIVRHSNKVR